VIAGRTKARAGVLSAIAALVAVGALAFSATPTGASGLIEIRGAENSSSHLRLTMNGGNVYVNGFLAPSGQNGCRMTRGDSQAVCSTGGVSGIEITMGSQGDKVEILDPMPVPVTAYLGSGSDKFIGNSEPDTCYPQGTKRNRCYGGAGNDICITGNQNSDCVGDGGDDYCKQGNGSDGCWGDFAIGGEGDPTGDDPRGGKPGNDICVMGRGMDGCHGGPGNDKLYGGPQADQLYGGAGRDYCNGGPGVGRSHGCETGPGH
jgi:Ca2+-binding RTX toxin-like protein